ncbi:MAG: DUF4159 domain-containing protein [Candidatus Hydrothermae bacterium]|nr:DUF4159 domain-containing protein [Candidatus Hydrothermae bacterium]
MAKFLRQQTGLDVDTQQAVVRLSDPNLFRYPFLFLTGHGNIVLRPKEIQNLRRYLLQGGFLFADDDYGMDTAFRREMARVFPDLQWVELPRSHPLYHLLYTFPGGLPKIHEHHPGPPRGYALIYQGRVMVFYAYNSNISDGWTDRYRDPPERRQQALRMGANLVLYALLY